jgi:hypothetical protein
MNAVNLRAAMLLIVDPSLREAGGHVEAMPGRR